jgi:hypothetical protein
MNSRKLRILVPFLLIVAPVFGLVKKNAEPSMREIVSHSLNRAVEQSLFMAKSLESKPGRLPKTINHAGLLETCNSSWWTSGFYPGQLWYLYEYSHKETLKNLADNFTWRVKNQMYTKNNHDVGFMIFCSFGNAFRVTGDSRYKSVIDTASQSLCTRFNARTGTIRSWDFSPPSQHWSFPVIIDNMMNLEMLMWASKAFDNRHFSDVAVAHANTTMKNHFRPDYSSYHLVSYDPATGNTECRVTVQGYSDSSAWARGQAWGLYGYTMMYRETKDTAYLALAKNIARFILTNPHLPADKIPYWDFDSPDIPHAYRDASAAAIIASALIELSRYVDSSTANEYISVAERQLRTLSSPGYMAEAGKNCGFILKHSVGNMPLKSEIDAPLTYADYYFVEALMRYKKYILK